MKIFLMLPLMLLAAIPLAADEPEQETAVAPMLAGGGRYCRMPFSLAIERV